MTPTKLFNKILDLTGCPKSRRMLFDMEIRVAYMHVDAEPSVWVDAKLTFMIPIQDPENWSADDYIFVSAETSKDNYTSKDLDDLYLKFVKKYHKVLKSNNLSKDIHYNFNYNTGRLNSK